MSSTSGVRSGNLLAEVARLRILMVKHRREARRQRKRAEMWKERAMGEIWAAQQRSRRSFTDE